jgi:hypothetical protein
MDKLLCWVLRAFNQEFSGSSRVDLYDAFTRFLIEQYAKKRRTVLIIDEAQNLSSQVLEELRMLPNINADKHMVLQLILVGQTQLRELMRQPELQQLRQRVSADYHLKALDENETRAYILHRTRHAGRDLALFTKEACDRVHRASRGIPRVINVICDSALVFGYARQAALIDEGLIEQVLGEMQVAGVLPAEDFGGPWKEAPAENPVKPVKKVPPSISRAPGSCSAACATDLPQRGSRLSATRKLQPWLSGSHALRGSPEPRRSASPPESRFPDTGRRAPTEMPGSSSS